MSERRRLNPNVLRFEIGFWNIYNFNGEKNVMRLTDSELCKKLCWLCLNLARLQTEAAALFCLQASIELIVTKKRIWKKRKNAFVGSCQKVIAWRDGGARLIFTIARILQHWPYKPNQSWADRPNKVYVFLVTSHRHSTDVHTRRNASLAYQQGAEESCVVCWAIHDLCRLTI